MYPDVLPSHGVFAVLPLCLLTRPCFTRNSRSITTWRTETACLPEEFGQVQADHLSARELQLVRGRRRLRWAVPGQFVRPPSQDSDWRVVLSCRVAFLRGGLYLRLCLSDFRLEPGQWCWLRVCKTAALSKVPPHWCTWPAWCARLCRAPAVETWRAPRMARVVGSALRAHSCDLLNLF